MPPNRSEWKTRSKKWNFPEFLNFSGLRDDEFVSRFCSVSLFVIGLVLITSMFSKHLLLGVLLLTVPAAIFLLAGSPVRILMVIFSLQLVFTVFQLGAVQLWIFRPDELLLVLFIWLWVLSIPDRSMKGIKIGVQGTFILIYLILYFIAIYRGFVAGRDLASLTNQIKTFGGYFLYFPFLWILTDKRNSIWLWRTLLISTVVGSIIYAIKGYLGYGENVYIRETTGVRVATRQPNAFAMVMLVFLGRLWKDWENRPSIILVILSFIVMGASVILSQTRGIWGGILLALAGAWILNLFRKKDCVRFGRKLITTLTVLAVLLIVIVFTVSAMGILSASNVAERTRTESGSYLTDVSTISRIVAWSAIIEELRGPSMISGKGFGALYTCFRPDLGTIFTVYYVDSAYFQIALNMGLIGVVVLLGIFISALVRAARLFLRTSSNQRAGISLGVFSAIIMLLFAAGFAATLTNYRYTVLWAFLLALLQNEIIREECEIPGVRG